MVDTSDPMREARPRYRVVIAMLLFIASVVNYLDRAALGVAAPFLQQELHLSHSALGVIFSTFFVGYAVFAFIGGQLADRYGPHSVYSWAASSWSVFCGATGAATGFVQLLVVRSLFGVSEGPMSAVTNRTISNWFPKEEVSRAIGFTFSGQMVGGAIAAPVIGFLALTYGWRWAFFVIGFAGLVWVFAWKRFATDWPGQNHRVGGEELRLIAKARELRAYARGDASYPLRSYLFRANTLSLGLGLFSMNYTVFILLSWLPSYLTDVFHMEGGQMSMAASIPWIGGFIGYVAGGYISDGVYSRSANKLSARRRTTIAPLLLASAALMAVPVSQNSIMAVGLIASTLMLLMCAVQSLWATLHEIVPENHMGGAGGFIHLISNISGIIGPTATGLAVQYLGRYDVAFFIASGFSIAGAIAMACFAKDSPRGERLVAATGGGGS